MFDQNYNPTQLISAFDVCTSKDLTRINSSSNMFVVDNSILLIPLLWFLLGIRALFGDWHQVNSNTPNKEKNLDCKIVK